MKRFHHQNLFITFSLTNLKVDLSTQLDSLYIYIVTFSTYLPLFIRCVLSRMIHKQTSVLRVRNVFKHNTAKLKRSLEICSIGIKKVAFGWMHSTVSMQSIRSIVISFASAYHSAYLTAKFKNSSNKVNNTSDLNCVFLWSSSYISISFVF